jgi:rhodanese-related sulfurtransferase
MKIIQVSLTLLLFLPTCGEPLRASDAQDPPAEIGLMCAQDLKRVLFEHRATLIDASGSTAFQQSHIPGALDYDAAGAKFGSVLPSNKQALIVVYATEQQSPRKQVVLRTAQDLGYTNLASLRGSFEDWVEFGGQVETASAASR